MIKEYQLPKFQWEKARWAIGLLILLSGGLKAYELGRGFLLSGLALVDRRLALIGVGCEMAWATWLLVGGGGIATWLLTVMMWMAFAGFNAYEMAVGRTACGCFGAVRISPRVTIAIDLVALGCTILSRPRGGDDCVRLARGHFGMFVVGTAMLASTAFGMWKISLFSNLSPSEDGAGGQQPVRTAWGTSSIGVRGGRMFGGGRGHHPIQGAHPLNRGLTRA